MSAGKLFPSRVGRVVLAYAYFNIASCGEAPGRLGETYSERLAMKNLKGCGAPESDYFVPNDGLARKKNQGARYKHICGETKKVGIFLCDICARKQNVGVW
jgi:hypothetical protein